MNVQAAPGRRDKLINRGKKAVFVGCLEETTELGYFWEPDMRTIRKHTLRNVKFFENEKGGDLDLDYIPKGQPSIAPIRWPVGRPRYEPRSELIEEEPLKPKEP